MTFTDPSNQRPDPSQPLTLNRPLTDPRVDSPYPRPPQPQPQRQLPPALFVPNSPDRGPEGWGRDYYKIQAATMYPGMPSNPDMPSGLESYPTMARSAGYLSRWGSDNVNQDAGQVSSLAMSFAPILDLISRGAWSKEFNASSLNQLKIQQQRLILAGEQLQQRHAQELLDYGTIIARADAISKTTKDPAEATGAIEDAREELRFLAETKYRHPALTAALDSSGGLEAAKYLLNQEDAQFRDLWSGVTSLKKAAGVDEDVRTADEWGEPRPASASGGGIFGTPRLAQDDVATETAPRAPDTAGGGDFNATLARNMKLSPQEMRAVNQEVASGKPSPGIESLKGGKETKLDQDIRRKVGLGVDASNAEIGRIAGDGSMTPEQKLAAIGRINPNVAGDIAGLADYRLNPREEGVVNRQRLAQLTGQIFKGQYNQANYENANRYYNTNSVENKVITRANDLVQNWMTLLKSLKPIGENKSIPREVIEAWIAGHGTGDPEYDTVYSQIRNIATQINAIQTLTGTPRVTLVHDMVANIQKDASPRSIRAQLLPDVQDAYAIINSYQDQWEGFGKKTLMPAITPSVFRDYRAIVRMNPYTGQVPEDSSLELKAAGMDPGKSSSRLSGEQRLEPLSLDRIRGLKGMISRYEHDPDPDKRQQAQEARERIGPVKNIDRRIPGVDEDTNATRR